MQRMECEVIERVKHSILKWIGHIERIPMYMNKAEEAGTRGQHTVKWKNKVLEHKRKGNEDPFLHYML